MTEPILHLPSVHFEHGPEIWRKTPEEYRELEKSFKPLSRRALLMAGRDDAVVLDKLPDPEYLARLKALGAGGARRLVPSSSKGACLSEDVALSPELVDFLSEWGGLVEVYMPSPAEERLSGVIGKPVCESPAGVVDLLNDKAFFIRMLEDLGAPAMETFMGNSDAVAARIRKEPGKPMLVRGLKSIGGSRVWAARTRAEREEALKALDRMGRDCLLILQPYSDVAYSPNIQLYIDDAEAVLFGETVQIMTGGVEHIGNLFDKSDNAAIREELIGQAKELAFEAASLGYRGVVGVDFIVTRDEKVFAVEMNARHNTSTHALWFVNRLFSGDPLVMAPSGLAAYLRVPSNRYLSAMQWIRLLGEDVLDEGKGSGILPYDTGGAELSAVIVGKDEADRERLINKARSLAV